MSQPASCPEPAALGRLLNATVTPGEQARINAHLLECPRCRTLLESMGPGTTARDRSGVGAACEAPADPTEPGVAPAVEQPADHPSQRAANPGDVMELSFLAPPGRPGSLGQLDHYEVQAIVGRGGTGMVLQAIDSVLQRVVAIKVLAPELAATRHARKRFIREAQAAAAVAHDHVVTIHGVQDGTLPYLVMQFVAGVSLDERIARNGALPVEEILRIGTQIAAGLAAAHAQGLVHRDIKPGNILLENGVERVKITDFGLARLVEQTGVVTSSIIAGTPPYMAPEQARGDPIDLRADLFSLGSVLYAMSTGAAPFQGSTSLAVLRRVCDEEPPPIASINPGVPPELVAVVAKLQRKDPAQRYQSATEVSQLLAALLARRQAHGPAARLPAPLPARQRHRRRAALWLVPVLGAALLVAWSIYYFGPWRQVRDIAAPPKRDAVALGVAAWEQALTTPVVCSGHTGAVYDVALASDKRTVASGGEDKKIRLWDAQTGKAGHVLPGHADAVRALAFSPDGQTLASGSDRGEVRLWDVAAGKLRKTLHGHASRVYTVAFSPDGQTLASAGDDREIHLLDLKTGRDRSWTEEERVNFIRRLAFAPDGGTLVSAGNQLTIWDVATGSRVRSIGCARTSGLALSADGRFIAAASWQAGVIALFNPADGKPMALWQAQAPALESIVLAQPADLLVSVGEDGVAQAWDPGKQQLRAKWAAHDGPIFAAALSADGTMLVTGGASEAQVKIWDLSALGALPPAAPPEPLAVLPLRRRLEGHTASVPTVAFTPDGKTLVTGCADRKVRLFDVATGNPGHELVGHDGTVHAVACSSDGVTLASGGGTADQGEILLWDARNGNQLGALPGHRQEVMDVAFSTDGQLLASCGFDKTVRVYNVAERQESTKFPSAEPGFSRRVRFTRDGRSLLVGGDLLSLYAMPGGVRKLDVPHMQTSDMRLSPRGDVLAAAGWKTGKVTLFDVATLNPGADWKAHRALLEGLAFSPDGRFLVSTSQDGTAKVWEVAEQRLCGVLVGHRGPVYGVAFAPDGQTVATCGSAIDFGVLLWDVSALGAKSAP